MGTAIKHPVPDRVKPSFVIFDIWALWRPGRQSARMLKITNERLNLVWHSMFYSCTHMATVGIKWLKLLVGCWTCMNVLCEYCSKETATRQAWDVVGKTHKVVGKVESRFVVQKSCKVTSNWIYSQCITWNPTVWVVNDIMKDSRTDYKKIVQQLVSS